MYNSKITIATWNLLWQDFDYLNRVEEASLWLKDADIICLQEVRQDSVNFVGDLLSKKLNLKISAQVPFAESLVDQTEPEPIATYLVILSNYGVLESGSIETPNEDYKFVAYTILDTPHRPTLVFSAHLQWKANREFERFLQVEKIALFAEEKEEEITIKYGVQPIVILAGDLNTVPESKTIQYLSGMEPTSIENQTYWVDSWSFLRKGEEGYTTNPKTNYLASIIAKKHVDNPDLVPGRRIDYILLKGWVYGAAGHPLKINLIGVEPRNNKPLPSDHYGLKLDIWNPPKDE